MDSDFEKLILNYNYVTTYIKVTWLYRAADDEIPNITVVTNIHDLLRKAGWVKPDECGELR